MKSVDFHLPRPCASNRKRYDTLPFPSRNQIQALSPLQPAPAPVLSPSPAGLLPDVDGSDGGSIKGGDAVVSPRWVLRPHMVAGGKGSLAQAVRALVDERRKSRAMSRSQLLPGCVQVCVTVYT